MRWTEVGIKKKRQRKEVENSKEDIMERRIRKYDLKDL